jgi:hypothetical protein
VCWNGQRGERARPEGLVPKKKGERSARDDFYWPSVYILIRHFLQTVCNSSEKSISARFPEIEDPGFFVFFAADDALMRQTVQKHRKGQKLTRFHKSARGILRVS